MSYVCTTCPRDHVRTCQKRANWSFLRAKVPKACQTFNLACQRSKRCADSFNYFSKELYFLIYLIYLYFKYIFYTLYKHIVCILQHRCILVSTAKIVRIVYFTEHNRWLLLHFTHYSTWKHSQKKREEKLSKKVFL